MDRELSHPDPTLIAVNLVTWLEPGHGWAVRVIETWDQGDREWRYTRKYDQVGRGALVDLLDLLVAEVSEGPEFS